MSVLQPRLFFSKRYSDDPKQRLAVLRGGGEGAAMRSSLRLSLTSFIVVLYFEINGTGVPPTGAGFVTNIGSTIARRASVVSLD